MIPAYYNEYDEFAAQWLRNLIEAGKIAPGEVDSRDLWDVSPDDLKGFGQVHLCAGIGIWSHVMRSVGVPDDYPLWSASFPCQPFSAAGQGLGFADERHLWPAGLHVIRERQPLRIVGEQSSAKAGLAWMELVQADLEAEGYAIGRTDICAAGFGTLPGRSYHIRQRLYWGAAKLAHPDSPRSQRRIVSGNSGDERIARACGMAGRLADSGSLGREVALLKSGRRDEAPRERQADVSGVSGPSRGTLTWLGEPDGVRRLRWSNEEDGGRGRSVPGRAGKARGVADTTRGADGTGEPRPEQREVSGEGFGDGGGAVDLILCNDPKGPVYRPVEVGTFPLASTDTHRVGQLSAYGNALDTEAAKAFLEAWTEHAP